MNLLLYYGVLGSRVAVDAVPARFRDLDVASGSAADYDRWLVGGGA